MKNYGMCWKVKNTEADSEMSTASHWDINLLPVCLFPENYVAVLSWKELHDS